MGTQALSKKLTALIALLATAACALALLAGCVAANEPASSNETDRGNNNGEATKPAEEENYTGDAAETTSTERATVPTHITINANGNTIDRRINISDDGLIATMINVNGGETATTTYSHDAQGHPVSGTVEFQGETRSFTTSFTESKDDGNTKYEIVNVFNTPSTYQASSLLQAASYAPTKVETDYTIDANGDVIEFDRTTTFTYQGKDYELDEDANFNADGLIVSCDAKTEELTTDSDVGDFKATFTYADENRSMTKLDIRDDGSNESSTFTLAYNEAGNVFRIAGDNYEETIEYYEVPIVAFAKAVTSIQPMLPLMSA